MEVPAEQLTGVVQSDLGAAEVRGDRDGRGDREQRQADDQLEEREAVSLTSAESACGGHGRTTHAGAVDLARAGP